MGKGRRKQMSKGRSGGDHKGGIITSSTSSSKLSKTFDEDLEDHTANKEMLDSDDLKFVDEGSTEDVENAFDMGGGSSSSESEEDSEDSEDSESDKDDAMEPAESSSDDDSVDNDDSMNFTWGSRKKSYYAGDTADLEIGQDEQDAFDEAQAAKDIMETMHGEMNEEDFFDDDDSDIVGDDVDEKRVAEKYVVTELEKSDLSSLPSSKKLSLLTKSDPNLPALLIYFRKKITELRTEVLPLYNAINSESRGVLGTNQSGYDYLQSKKDILTSIVLNSIVYFKLRIDPDVKVRDLENHPVVERLNELEGRLGKLRKIEERDGLKRQIEKVLEAVELMKNEEDEEENTESMDEDDASSSNRQQQQFEDDQEVDSEAENLKASDGSDDDDEESDIDDDLFDDDDDEPKKSSKPVRRAAPPSSSSSKKSTAEDPSEEDEEKVKKALAAMEADLKNYNDGLSDPENFSGNDSDEDSEVDELDIKLSDHDASELYYAASKTSKDKKKLKSDLYTVAPKFPSTDELVTGERKANYKILKNRGLVAHKAKINRNPRVKKREQYRKKIIARNGAIRKVRTGEAEGYAGEETGIKSNLSRSKKLKS
ncbi:hypothetical protein TrVE_jg10756 [Triparma verrucosa]|uniref:Sas10 C-terminal domain-containing protein n=1 Tax=Triparma verrucosa TaxID=1606542 RepID=A0A9W7BTJ3_9STRA|nr:hypothetical protein TrVE_jg10756 [Triparma verrucosa]